MGTPIQTHPEVSNPRPGPFGNAGRDNMGRRPDAIAQSIPSSSGSGNAIWMLGMVLAQVRRRTSLKLTEGFKSNPN
jgi:hypothetical protein